MPVTQPFAVFFPAAALLQIDLAWRSTAWMRDDTRPEPSQTAGRAWAVAERCRARPHEKTG